MEEEDPLKLFLRVRKLKKGIRSFEESEKTKSNEEINKNDARKAELASLDPKLARFTEADIDRAREDARARDKARAKEEAQTKASRTAEETAALETLRAQEAQSELLISRDNKWVELCRDWFLMHQLAPPHDIPYFKKFVPKLVSEPGEIKDCLLFELKEYEGKRVSYMLLVSKSIFPPLTMHKCHCSILSPLDILSYSIDGITLNALVYPPFQTFYAYTKGKKSSIITSKTHKLSWLSSIITPLICGLIDFYDHGISPPEISAHLIAILPDKRASFLCPNPKDQPKVKVLENSLRAGSFQSLAEMFERTCDHMHINWEKQDLLFKTKLEFLLRCMKKATSRSKCLRLRNAPVLSTDHKIITYFISLAYSDGWSTSSYHSALLDDRVSWFYVVSSLIEGGGGRGHKYPELLAVHFYENPNQNEGDIDNAFEFLRNCVEHLNGNERKKSGNSSKYMMNPHLLLRFIDEVKPGFLDHIFNLTYKVKEDNAVFNMLDNE